MPALKKITESKPSRDLTASQTLHQINPVAADDHDKQLGWTNQPSTLP
jgi:hypothetical protein